MKKRSLLIFVSLVLCFSTLFVSCDLFGGKNNAEQTTVATTQTPVADNSDDSFDGSDDTLVVDTEADIKMLTEHFNSTQSAGVDPEPFYNIDKTIYSYISGMKLSLSNLKVNDEAMIDKLSIDGENICVELPGVEEKVNFKIDDTLLLLGLIGSNGNVSSTVIIDDLQELKEIYSPENFPIEDLPEIKIPEITASDFVHEGKGVYSIKQEYITEYYKEIFDTLVTSGGIGSADKAAIESYIEKMVCTLKFKVSASTVVSTEMDLSFPSDVIADFAKRYMDVPELNEEYSYNFRVVQNIKGGVASISELECDVFLPYMSYEEGDILYVAFFDIDLDLDVDTKLITNGADIFSAKADMDIFAKAYNKKGNSYVHNKDYDEELAEGKSTMSMSTSLSKGKFAFDMTFTSAGEESKTKVRADVDFEKVSIPKLSASASLYVDKFKNISKNKEKIDTHVAAVMKGISGQLTEDMLYKEIEYHYSDYDLVVSFEVVYDDDWNLIAEVNGYKFYTVNGVTADYTVKSNGNSFTLVSSASSVI